VKWKIFVCLGVIGILGIGYNAYHWFDGLTQYRIGYLYSKGIILNKNEIESSKWFERSIKQYEAKNDAKSKNKYDKWESEAYNKDLEKRASSGDIFAIASLGRCYFIGDGV